MTDHSKRQDDQKRWYIVVRVEDVDRATGRVRIVARYDNLKEAEAHANRTNLDVYKRAFDRPPKVDTTFTFRLDTQPELERKAAFIEWQRDQVGDIVVCKWDRRSGQPTPGRFVTFDTGISYSGFEERTATPVNASNPDHGGESGYVAVRLAHDIRSEGYIIGFNEDRYEARKFGHARSREPCELKTEMGGNADRIAHRAREKLVEIGREKASQQQNQENQLRHSL
jgi:hypothetical protein